MSGGFKLDIATLVESRVKRAVDDMYSTYQ